MDVTNSSTQSRGASDDVLFRSPIVILNYSITLCSSFVEHCIMLLLGFSVQYFMLFDQRVKQQDEFWKMHMAQEAVQPARSDAADTILISRQL